jgi:translation initiation factor RLI1
MLTIGAVLTDMDMRRPISENNCIDGFSLCIKNCPVTR